MLALRQILALVEVQLRTLLNSLRYGSGGGEFKLSLALAVLWYGFWIFSAVGCASLPSLVGIEDMEGVLPAALLFILGYWQLAPLLTLSLGVSLDVRKMTFYPISLRELFAVECILRLGTGAEMLILLVGFLGGLALAGSPHLAGLILALVLFVALNVFLSAGIRNFVERVFHQRRVREFLLIVLLCGTLLPQLLIWSENARSIGQAVYRVIQGLPLWVSPSQPAADLATKPLRVEPLAVLTAMVAAAALFAYWQFRRGYAAACEPSRSSGSARGAIPRGVFEIGERLVPRFLPDPIGVLVEKEVKYLWRSPRFRLPFVMGFTFGVLAWVPIMGYWREGWGAWMQQSAVALVSLYAFLLLGPVMFLNRFGFDRGATRFYFWLPLSLRELLVAKNLATVILAAFEVALVAVVCLLVGLPVGPLELVEAVVIAGIALLFLLSVGNFMSIRFPAASNPDRISRAGAGHGLRATVQFLLFPLSLAPVGFVLWVRHSLDNPAVFAAALALCAIGGAGVYLTTLSAMARLGEEHREEFLSRLAESGGPITTE